MRWFYVNRPLRRAESIDETRASDALIKALAQVDAYKQQQQQFEDERAATKATSSAVTCPSSSTACGSSCVLVATALVALSFAAGRYSTK